MMVASLAAAPVTIEEHSGSQAAMQEKFLGAWGKAPPAAWRIGAFALGSSDDSRFTTQRLNLAGRESGALKNWI
jgi:hypothetical protein